MTHDSDFAALAADAMDFIRCARAPIADEIKREEEFNRLALRLFTAQFESVTPYRRLCESRGRVPGRNVGHWREIPALPAAAFKQSDITSLPGGDRPRSFQSSGTTSREAGRHFHNQESLRVYELSLLEWFQPHLLPEGAGIAAEIRFISLTPPGASAPASSLVHMFETVCEAFPWRSKIFAACADPVRGWILPEATLRQLLDQIASDPAPVLFLGTAFSYVHLLDYLEDRKLTLTLPQGSRALETGGYKGKSREMPKGELHAAIMRRLGVAPEDIVSEYGMSELSSQAYDSVAGIPEKVKRRFQFPPWTRIRLICPETGQDAAPGEPGLITVIDLANIRSCLALQTEDLGLLEGDGFRFIGRATNAAPRGCSLMTA